MFSRSLFLSLSALTLLPQLVSAHTYVVGITVNGVDKKDWTSVGQASSYMRQPSSNSPLPQNSLTTPFMACNDRGTTEVPGILKVSAGDTIEPTWWHADGLVGNVAQDPIDPSHKGPLTTWISPLEANTKGDVWVQIASEGYYSESQEWAVNRMIANGGKNKVVVPSSLKAGKYLVRFELIGLHEGQHAGGSQFYPNCAQIEVTGSGQVSLPKGVAIPGFYTHETPGVVYNIYGDLVAAGKAYIAPGTGVWDGTARYSTDTCHERADGLAKPGYCQGGSNSPASSSQPSSSPRPSSSSTVRSISTVISNSPTQAIPSTTSSTTRQVSKSSASSQSTTGSYKSTTIATTFSSTSIVPSASTSTAASPSETFVDYSSCMRAYNRCLDDAQPKQGGPADFLGCENEFNGCRSYQRRFRRSVHRGQH